MGNKKDKKPRRLRLTIISRTVKAFPATIPVDFKIIEGKPVWGISKAARKEMGLTKKDERMMLEALRLNWKNKPPRDHIGGDNGTCLENNAHSN